MKLELLKQEKNVGVQAGSPKKITRLQTGNKQFFEVGLIIKIDLAASVQQKIKLV